MKEFLKGFLKVLDSDKAFIFSILASFLLGVIFQVGLFIYTAIFFTLIFILVVLIGIKDLLDEKVKEEES